jgi:hypothetical protein
MNRRVVRTYSFSANEVAEALIAWMKSKDMPTPMYVGNAGTTTWDLGKAGVRVEWTDEDAIDLQ